MNLRKARWETLGLVLILLAGATLRLYGLNWDGGHWLHPDERQIYFVTIDLGWPSSLAEALSPDSPLNPGFFAYGSLPFYLLKLVAVLLATLWPALGDPNNLHLVGRPIAALFDLGTIYLTYRLASMLLPPSRRRGGLESGALLPAALASLAVLHVQLAHFYTSDPLLTFFVLLTLNLAVDVARGGRRGRQAALGIAFGLAMSTKVVAALLIVPIFAACYMRATRGRIPEPGEEAQPSSLLPPVSAAIRCAIPGLVLAACVFIIVQPYALIDWRTFLGDTMRESQIAWGWLDAPYTRQYAGTLPYLYSMWQAALWGMVLPFGLAAWAALGVTLIRWIRGGAWATAQLLAWAGPYLAFTGLLYAKYLRYMLPLVPILCILVAQIISTRKPEEALSAEPAPAIPPPSSVVRRPSSILHAPSVVTAIVVLLLLVSLAYALAFASIYIEPHTWITASKWFYEHAPADSVLALEEWDTALPLPLEIDGQSRRIEEYNTHTLALYSEPDDDTKWQRITANLAQSDYVIIASRRLYGSIPRQPARYPLTTHYYERLFSGELGFELAMEFTRGPSWLNPRLPPLPGAAPQLLLPDESFVVYDHPRTLIFHNVENLPAGELMRRLQRPLWRDNSP